MPNGAFFVNYSGRRVVEKRLFFSPKKEENHVYCERCLWHNKNMEPDAPERAFIGAGPDEPVTLYKGEGCEYCGNIGYKGRLAIHEVLPIATGLRPLIVKNAPTDRIKQKALDEGMNSLKMDGIQKALKGLTTVEEVMRVAYADEN